MSEMTATRMGERRVWRAATLVAAAALWALAAWLLWRSRVPGDLHLPRLDPRDSFGAHVLARTRSYQRFVRIDSLLSLVALLVALGVWARKGAGFVRESAAGRIGTGMLLAMLAFAIVWLAQLPFGLAGLWWDRRYGVSHQGYPSWLLENWLGLGFTFLFVALAIVIVMGLAQLLGRRWWMLGAPAFVGIAVLFAFLQPFLLVNGTRRISEPWLRADVARLERIEHVEGVRVRVLEVAGDTRQVNAFATGLGGSRSVYLYDTFLDGGFTHDEVAFVLAHEFGHLERNHVWKGLAWYALFAIPAAWIVTLATRRRGGLTEPVAIPLALFVLTALQIGGLPLNSMISRRIEAEADWMALQATRDPQAAAGVFRKFAPVDLEEPRPPTWDYVLFENHPTVMQRIAMARAWRLRHGR
jgi:STE24 endopeptidase